MDNRKIGKKERKKGGGSFFENAAVLMFASILVKLIGALFSIPLTNLYGAEGNGIYTNAYYIYTFMFVISTAGLPVAISKMVAEANALGRRKEVNLIAKISLTTLTAVGLFFSLVMFLGIDVFLELLKQEAPRYAILAITPCIFFTCILSAIRGYYQGLSNMVPTAVSQVIEALGKLVVGLGLAFWLDGAGYSVEWVVAGAMLGVTVGTVVSSLYVILIRARDHRREKRAPLPDSGECASSKSILKRLATLAIPVTISSAVLSLTNLIDMFLVSRRLQEGCFMTPPEANYLYGAYGMSVKFFNLPQTVIVGIGVSIIPAIAAALAIAQKDRVKRLTESAFRLTGLLAFPCAFGLAVLPEAIMGLLYYKQLEDVAVASPLLTLLGPAVFFVGMVYVTNAILQATGHVRLPIISMLLGGLIKLVVNYILVGTPGINIYGAPIGTTLCYAFIMVLNLIFISRIGVKFSIFKSLGKPFLSAAVMGLFAWLVYKPLAGFIGVKLGVLVAIALSAVLYLLLLIATKALPKEDILMLPKGEKIAKLLRLQ